jgi:branched-chain amino acid transport system ATP-binding protein
LIGFARGSAPLLSLTELTVVYQGGVLALDGVSFDVAEGGIAVLLGANGAGKSTVLKTVSKVLAMEQGEIRGGAVHFRGEPIHRMSTADLVRRGIVHVLEGRRLFRHLTVEENLRMGAYARTDSAGVREDIEAAYKLFPRLGERRGQRAGFLSGGEQQMAAIARGFMARPSLMLVDEPTMGLAPVIASEVYASIHHLNSTRGVSFLIAEQSTSLVMSVADTVNILDCGRLAFSKPRDALDDESELMEFYFGTGGR